MVANLSDPVVLTFFHDQLPVGGETASQNPPGTEGEGGLRPRQLRVRSQSSRSMLLAYLCRVCCVFWGCITIMASLCALVCTAFPSPGDASWQMCHIQNSHQGWGHSELIAPWLIHGSVRCLLKAEPLVWKRGPGRRCLLHQLLTEWSLPGAHSHRWGSLVCRSHSLSPETILPPAPCCPLTKVMGRQQTHSCILTRACGFVIAEERHPTVRLLAGHPW